jgi:molecular chaperone GrpE
MLQRTAAEFDNYKKLTAREKEALYSEALCDAVGAFLPVVDNLDRALDACSKEGSVQTLRDGVELVSRQLKDIMKKLGVEEIKSTGEEFDPQLHNAVMHIEDDAYGHNVVIEEFQKGYRIKDRIIRHSMVKVAN